MADPSDMLLFASVVRLGGISAASRALGVSKQSVSERVARLEQALGVRLLERTTRSVRPTDAGLAYAQRCEEVSALIQDADREARGAVVQPTGTLRVSAPVELGRKVLGPVMRQLLTRHPHLRAEVVLEDRHVRIVEEGFDAALRVGPLEDSSERARRVGQVAVCLVASPTLARTSHLHGLEALTRAPCILVRSGETWRLGGQLVRPQARLVTGDLEAAHDAAVEGLGVARLPHPVCADALARGTLVQILPALSQSLLPVFVVMAPGRHTEAKVKVFLEAVTGAMAQLAASEPAAR